MYQRIIPLLSVSFFLLTLPPVGLSQKKVSFANQAKAVIEKNCLACHGVAQMAGLDLRERKTTLKGGTNGPALVPGNAEASLLFQAVLHQGDLKMPAGQDPLPAEDVEILRKWIEEGAPWAEGSQQENHQSTWWSFREVKEPSIPSVKDNDWVRNPIDAFVLQKLEEKELKPAPRAEKLKLLRRAKFDLHGLPPTQEEIREFLSDTGSGAFARLVDRLLASPRYGERWGRHWLDVARYADSTGLDEDLSLPYSYLYRDYVIETFNLDIPFNQFVSEQIAGDMMPAEKPGEMNKRGIVATGFLALGPRPLAQQDKMRVTYDTIDEQIDTFSKAFLGLTLSCARCHDHKFDPITQKDYYALASIFASTRSYEDVDSFVSKLYFKPLASKEVHEGYVRHQDKIKLKNAQIDSLTETELAAYLGRRYHPRLPEYMVAAWNVYEKGEDLSAIASKEKLDQPIVERWIAYLKPGEEFRPYLKNWHEANASNVRQLAEEYNGMFAPLARDWHEQLNTWANAVEAAVQEDKKAPEKPKFLGERALSAADRFFAELTFPQAQDNDFTVEHNAPFAVLKKDRDSVLSTETKQVLARLRKELEELEKTAPPEPLMATAVTEGEPVEQHIFLRGSHKNPGDTVPKLFPVTLAGTDQTPIRKGSGRKELAEWLIEPSHPLTARVMVNRIWHWHFGHGLVRSPNNFGATGEKPTHPDLLDYLAVRFQEKNWSIKEMHRLIMNSSTYQMSSHSTDEARANDPENRLWSRIPRRKLTIEEMRDSLLFVDGSLDLTMGGTLWPKDHRISDVYGKKPIVDPETVKRRSVYLPLIRNKMPSVLKLFDFVDSTTSTGKRNESNVAPQALYTMNSEFIHERSGTLAKNLLADGNADDAERLERAYWITLGRKPTDQEAEMMKGYIENYPKSKDENSDHKLAAWKSFCHVLLASNEFNHVE